MTTRTFTVLTSLGDAIRFVKLDAHEGLSEISEYNIDLLSSSPDIDPLDLLGKNAAIQIATQDDVRYLNGIVTMFSYIGPDSSANRLYRYKMRMNSWLVLADKTEDCRIYQELTVPQLIGEVLSAFGMQVEFKLIRNYPIIPYIVQWNESAYHFVCWVAERYGLYFYTRHSKDGHVIVFTDGLHPTLPEYDTISFLAPGSRNLKQEEYISDLEIRNEVHSGRYVTTSYDYKNPNANLEQSVTVRKGHANDALEVFEWEGNYVDREAGDKQADVRREQQQHDYQVMRGKSNVRGLAPGYTFKMQKNPRNACNIEYLIVSVDYVFVESPDTTSQDGSNVTSWSLEFTVRPSKERFYPERKTEKPTTGLQTAVVSGPPGAEIHTNDYGEVKITYPWDRRAKNDHTDTKWIPVAGGWAGAGNGDKFLARIGDSVMVDHIDGDPSRPIVICRAHDQRHMPTSFSNTGSLPSNHALAGIKSRELGGYRYNQLVFDDSSGQIKTLLECQHENTQLSMGYLTQPRYGSAVIRGEGYDLRTDGWGALRAGKGMLITTYAQHAASGKHLDSSEATGQLDAALVQAKAHSTQAVTHNADELKANDSLAHLKEVSAQQHLQGTESAPGYGEAILVLSSPSGIAQTTQKAMAFAAGTDIHFTSQLHTNMSVGRRLSMAIGEAWSVFVERAGIKLFAGKGKVQIQAQSDNLELTAQKDVLVHSVGKRVEVVAAEEILLTSGGAYIRISKGNIEICAPGNITKKAANYSLNGPSSLAKDLPAMPKTDSKTNEFFVLVNQKTGETLAGHRYKVTTETGTVVEGVSDAQGKTQLVKGKIPEIAKIQIFPKKSG